VNIAELYYPTVYIAVLLELVVVVLLDLCSHYLQSKKSRSTFQVPIISTIFSNVIIVIISFVAVFSMNSENLLYTVVLPHTLGLLIIQKTLMYFANKGNESSCNFQLCDRMKRTEEGTRNNERVNWKYDKKQNIELAPQTVLLRGQAKSKCKCQGTINSYLGPFHALDLFQLGKDTFLSP
jgi:hypothetical protein